MPETIHSERWISLQQVCEYLGVKRYTLHWIDQCDMPFKFGKLWRFKTTDIDEWVKKGGVSDEREAIR